MSNANIDELNGQAVLDLIMGRLGRKASGGIQIDLLDQRKIRV
jgi:hypothetical protein